jgi:hypothetical protein
MFCICSQVNVGFRRNAAIGGRSDECPVTEP